MKAYNSNSVEITWQGLDFKEGLASGTLISFTRTGPSFTMKDQANGKVIRSFNPTLSGTATITVNQSSQLYQDLLAQAQLDRVNQNVVGPMVIKEVSSGRQVTLKSAFIQTVPDETFAMEDSDISWVFGFEAIENTNGAPFQNEV
jgi:hypothetical protein